MLLIGDWIYSQHGGLDPYGVYLGGVDLRQEWQAAGNWQHTNTMAGAA